MKDAPHISVCVCTYKRTEGLKCLLDSLRAQETDGRFTFSIAVVDNDALQSAKPVVSDLRADSGLHITYTVEPQQSIALARNKVVASATGDLVAFIDDDEFANPLWLLTLFEARQMYDVDGVLGPVLPHYAPSTPEWVVKGKFYDRPTHSTGSVVRWVEARTGNVLMRRRVFEVFPEPFRQEFRAGEDQDFFRRAIVSGFRFIWCDEAVAYESVPPIRWKRTVLLRRALLRGATAALQPTLGIQGITKSVIAVPVYAMALPFALVAGHHWFMRILVKLCDHLGKLLAIVGINPIREPYVTE